MKRLLVTGSSGKLSTEVILPLLKELSWDVVQFDLQLGHNILEKDSIYRVLKDNKVSAIIHAAAIAGPTKTLDYRNFEKVNTQGSVNLIQCAQEFNIDKFIFFSSFAYYGTDAWMRNRNEIGPIVGKDVAIPKYFPMDEKHPSILEYHFDELSEYNGKYYGLSKAKVEKYVCDHMSDIHFQFLSMRLAGYGMR